MLPSVSELLLKTQWPTIDTSFNRAQGYEEFEVEAWFLGGMKCKAFGEGIGFGLLIKPIFSGCM